MYASELNPGTLLNERYEIISLLGSGGTGSVYKACDLELNRFVAIKFLFDIDNQAVLARLRKEASLLAKVKSPSIVSIFSIDRTQDGIPFVVTEFIEGTTLSTLVAQAGKLPVPTALDLTLQLAGALRQLHQHKIIHRDLKPENVIVQQLDDNQAHQEGEISGDKAREPGCNERPTSKRLLATLIDLGLSRCLTGNQSTTATGALVGTPPYMSPEQCAGRKADERSDLYSLGCVLHELLTGQLPFQCDSSLGYIFKHMNEKPQGFQGLVEHERLVDLEAIVNRCLLKEPTQRYQTADELIQDIEAFRSGAPIAPHKSRERVRRRSTFTIATITSIIVMAFVAALAHRRPSPAPTQPGSDNVATKTEHILSVLADAPPAYSAVKKDPAKLLRMKQEILSFLASNPTNQKLVHTLFRTLWYIEGKLQDWGDSEDRRLFLSKALVALRLLTPTERLTVSLNDLADLCYGCCIYNQPEPLRENLLNLLFQREGMQAASDRQLLRLTHEYCLFERSKSTEKFRFLLDKYTELDKTHVLTHQQRCLLYYLHGRCCLGSTGENEKALLYFRKSLDERVRARKEGQGWVPSSSTLTKLINKLESHEDPSAIVLPLPFEKDDEAKPNPLEIRLMNNQSIEQHLKARHTVATTTPAKQLEKYSIYLFDSGADDRAVSRILENYPSVALLDLRGTGVTDSIATSLASRSGLRDLRLSETKISQASVDHLRKTMPSCRIESEFGNFEPSSKSR